MCTQIYRWRVHPGHIFSNIRQLSVHSMRVWLAAHHIILERNCDNTMQNSATLFALDYLLNSPIVCTVLSLDGCNCCSGNQGPTAQHICKIVQSSSCKWTMKIMKWKIISCHLMSSSSYCNVAHREFHFLLFSKDFWSKHWEEDVGLLGLVLESSCLVASAQTAGKLFTHYYLGELWPDSTKFLQDDINQCLTLIMKLNTR